MLYFHSSLFARIGVAAVLMAALLWAAPLFCTELRQIGVVEVSSLNMRRGPAPEAEVVRVLQKGTEVRILGEDGKWLQVIHDGQTGYVYNDSRYLKRFTRHKVTGGKKEELEVARARAKEIQRRISRKEKEIQTFEKKENVVLRDLEEIDRQRAGKRRNIKELMAAAEQAAARITQLEAEAEEIREKLGRKKQYAEKRLVALYKLCRLGKMNILASADSVHQLFSRRAAIERVLENDEAVITEMLEQKRRLSRIIKDLEEKRTRKRELASEYEESLNELAAMREERRQMLAALKNRKSERKETLEYLRKAAERMDKTISELRRQSYKGQGDFGSYQGLLKMPVQGKIISNFGKNVKEDSGVLNYRNGIEIRSERGTPVRAVFEGKTVFTDWIKGYGRVIIISHGNNYHTVYAHIEDLFSKKGETVESGQVIATVGDSGSTEGPALYFEIRHHGEPVDPAQWIDNG